MKQTIKNLLKDLTVIVGGVILLIVFSILMSMLTVYLTTH
jgi:lipopolysaccharide/colanic/teichoic acid biosynthesis glycosyltransferase